MKIQIKRSNQLVDGEAKAPEEDMLDYGELAVNFNEADPAIFIKASDGAGSSSIVRLAGANVNVDPPPPPITFTAIITDTGADGNLVGKVLTAKAQNISNGVDPVESAYQWYINGTADSTSKTRTIQSSDIGGTITCDITVSENGTGDNPVTQRATYAKTPAPSGSISTPTIYTPDDGAGLTDPNTAPDADDLAFTSTVPSGTDITTYGNATWEVDTDANFSSPMTATKVIAPANSLQFLLPNERGAIVLADDTTYNIRLKYDSADPSGVESAYSDVNQFKTAPPPPVIPPLEDGWNPASAPEANSWFAVAYGGGKFVALSTDGTNRVMYSTDAINWTSAAAAEANTWYSVTYGNGKFVAVSTDGTNRAMYSTDGINWTSGSGVPASNWASVTYGDGKFVAVAQTGSKLAMYSTDGINWTSATAAKALSWYSVTYGDGKFVAVANTGTNQVMYSSNGINWTSAAPAEVKSWYSVAYGNGKFVAISLLGEIMYSTDAINWTSAPPADQNFWYEITYGGGKFLAVASSGANQIIHSTDGINWTKVAAPEPNGWYSVTYGDNKFVAVAFSGTNRIMWSETGEGPAAREDGWNLESLPSGPWSDIAYGDGKYVIIGGDGSTDGKAIYSDSISGPWTQITDSKLNQPYLGHYKVAYGNGVWVITSNAGSSNSTIYYTNDLSGAWQEASTIPNNKNLTNLCFGGGKFVAFSGNGSLNPAMHSTDGNVWTSAASYGGTTDLDLRFTNGLIYADNKFIAYGNHFGAEGSTTINAFMYSEDGGVNWVKQTTNLPGGDYVFQSMAYDGSRSLMAVFGGSNKPALYANITDLSLWILATSFSNDTRTSIVYGDNKFVTSKNTGPNNIEWIDAPTSASWTEVALPEAGRRVLYYINNLFVGIVYGKNNLVWSESGKGPAATFTAYDADNNKSVNDLNIVARYGVDPTADNTHLGIYELTEQPTGIVAAYVPDGNKYKPVIDLSQPLEQAQAEAAQANARLDEANATIETMRSNFETRIAALESES